MASKHVWICDKCDKTNDSVEIPDGWVRVSVCDDGALNLGLDWCASCWRIIKDPYPKAAVVRGVSA